MEALAQVQVIAAFIYRLVYGISCVAFLSYIFFSKGAENGLR